MSASAETPISPGLARFFTRVEKYVAPLAYALLAWQRWQAIRALPVAYRAVLASGHPPAHGAEIYSASLVRHGLLLALMVFISLALLFNRPAREQPATLAQVLVPLVASFYFVLYAVVDSMPEPFRANLIPPALQSAAALAGLALSVLGYTVCLWAIFHLRHSFALLVSVREVVTGGPYRYVRHPIYLGYFLDQGGLVLAGGSLGMALLAVGFVLFQVRRAAMEEAKLSHASPAYRHYVRQTGGFWPRKGSRFGDSRSDDDHFRTD